MTPETTTRSAAAPANIAATAIPANTDTMPHPGGVGKPERSGDDVANFKHRPSYLIQLPPLAEQTRIVVEVERRLSVVEELEAVVSANLQRATRLRRSFLRRSFTGSFTGPKFMQNVEA